MGVILSQCYFSGYIGQGPARQPVQRKISGEDKEGVNKQMLQTGSRSFADQQIFKMQFLPQIQIQCSDQINVRAKNCCNFSNVFHRMKGSNFTGDYHGNKQIHKYANTQLHRYTNTNVLHCVALHGKPGPVSPGPIMQHSHSPHFLNIKTTGVFDHKDLAQN